MPVWRVHVICDNLATDKASVVHRWLLAHPRFHLHFTPTYSSWINQVERWFAELQRRCLDRGVFCSLDQLTTTLEDWIERWNTNAHPFTWTRTADQILDRICRYRTRISGPAGAVATRQFVQVSVRVQAQSAERARRDDPDPRDRAGSDGAGAVGQRTQTQDPAASTSGIGNSSGAEDAGAAGCGISRPR
ncbi:transposase [Streptomycetaceae bacterium NBC_01309]